LSSDNQASKAEKLGEASKTTVVLIKEKGLIFEQKKVAPENPTSNFGKFNLGSSKRILRPLKFHSGIHD